MTSKAKGASSGPYEAFGAQLRAQRALARLTLRQLAELAQVSNPYLSQIERGLHRPSVQVIRNIADALGLPPERLLAEAAGLPPDEPDGVPATEAAINADPRLDVDEKEALLSVYRSMVSDRTTPGRASR